MGSDNSTPQRFPNPNVSTLQSVDKEDNSAPQKCYNPNDSTFTFVDREDELDFLCEGFSSLRAQMSCGHAVTPMSLTNWCLKQLEQGESKFVCGQFGCGAKWSYKEVCKMALLTPEEQKHFKKTMAKNADKRRKCPECKSPAVRQSENNLCVRCQVCTAKKGHIYEFCWQCLREWKGPKPRSDRCENIGCCNSALETLKTCPEITTGHLKGCPSIRACPTCGSLLEHKLTGCRQIECSRCKFDFCFVCLKTYAECIRTRRLSASYPCCVAPRQTSTTVWT
ncbi:potential E3 ubiquitin-protein ligase ariadne-2-like [Kryptolebias marmoratus]|uniref:potential E3 ubiquitin-protein ligase ariadne-2-like n=1 Tax=Kryptolebias marmoratus TaxID=37003 RepID=UPI000D52FF4E|nr:potential E3 ubiquitin-protein ligase ariadne-2-like [Kryptolebias marmoratus]XP_037832695.1 potential E3 ubiquitin-protein ligase ariadne-2-like [Kryptolebias marmoratus]